MSEVKKNEFICAGLESIAQHLNDICCLEVKPSEAAEIKISVNSLNVTLRFAEKPKSEIQDDVLRVLVSSYKSRITAL